VPSDWASRPAGARSRRSEARAGSRGRIIQVSGLNYRGPS
jgi:hypothetical protein